MIAAEKPALSGSVLVLNRAYVVVHVVNVRRAFALIYRELAEVIDLEDGQFANHDFESWLVLSDLRFGERTEYDEWVCSVNFQVQVPRVVRLLHYDRVPRQTLRFNRRNLFARQPQLPVLRPKRARASVEHGSRAAAQSGWPDHLGEHCLLLRPLQHQERWPHATRGTDESAKETDQAALQSGSRAEAQQSQIRKLANVPACIGPRLGRRLVPLAHEKGPMRSGRDCEQLPIPGPTGLFSR